MRYPIALAACLLAGLVPASAQDASPKGALSGLRVGTFYWGETVTTAQLEGKVVLVQLAGL